MNISIDSKEFSDFVDQHKLFEITRKYCIEYLSYYWENENDDFVKWLNANLETVIKEYKFKNEYVSFSKSYFFEPPLDYIAVCIRLFDKGNKFLYDYVVLYDHNLEYLDDTGGCVDLNI